MNWFPAFRISIYLSFLAILSGLSARGQATAEPSAFERIKAKAEANDADAQLALGWMYDNGESVPRDLEQAFRWWLKAAEQGQPAGQFNVGLSYRLGLGVTRDYSEAAKWFQKTVEPMDTFASYELGWMSAAGRGIPKNHDDAVKRWKESLFQGYAVAKRELNFVEFSYSGTQVFLGRVEMATNTPVGMTAYRGYRIARGELEFPCITFMNHEGRLLEDVHVIRTDPVSLFYRFADGVCCGEEKLANLPLEFQKQFNYDSQRAAAFEATQKAARLAQETYARRSEATALEPSLQESNKDRIVTEIVSDYRKTHTYVGTQTGAKADIFVCGDMACDVWNMVETKGIKAKIQIGNVKRKIKSLLDADHAWVMAEVSPGKWLALETTGGFAIRFNENDKYYYGHSFSDPKEFKEYSTLAREYNTAIGKERNAVMDYNQMVNQSNGADDLRNVRLTSELDRKAAVVDSRRADLQEVAGRLKALLLEKD